ncbi:DUF349 domain-containing protein [uncultured Draconibacterium sp.]|uniref:DUF349 domain-containing protein n=1 Tax=uncultured Draconibacterium sp. TaxID=1573823 RepID=UPI0029C6DEB9|nr:DUF349 domain-containing protein [uncultured Draconibacterium sp.]
MEPKDLKNSEELKRTENTDLENSEVKPTSEEAAKSDEPNTVEDEKSVEPTEEKTPEQQPVEPVEETVKEEPKAEVAEEPQSESESESISKEESTVESTEDSEDTTEEKVAEETQPEPEPKVAAVETEQEQPDEIKAEKAEPVKEEKPKKREPVDYSKHSQVELVNALRDVLEGSNDINIKEEIDTIKAAFYKNLNENIEADKKKFIADGGAEEEFKAEEDPYEKDIKDLLKQYRHIRIEHNKQQESEKEENLQKKYEVIEKIKGLINNEESINKTFNDFRDLQREWREIGLVPQSKMKNLWDTYHFHVENFYDYIKINRELRDLDLKKNLEAKIKLCERAEELLVEEPSILKAFNTLQKYHEQWREIGPVPREQKDDIWERFKAATNKINKKHQEFFENRKVEQKKNLEAKTALCEKAEEIIQEEILNHKEWDEKSKQLIELQKVWRTIGFAPRKDNNKIYERFRIACDAFFNAKRSFYSKNKEEQQNNLQLKTDLCVQAESLKDSEDWRKTTQDFINIQKKWKEIGPVPRKHSDILWKRFRAACDFFFDKKSVHFTDVDTEQDDNLKLKEDLIKEVENFKPVDNVDQNLESLKTFQRRWTEIGHVPFKKKDEIKVLFRDAINKLFDDLNLDDEKRNLLKFRNKMSSFSESSRGQNKMRMERDKYMNKMKQLENDLVLLDNNIGFFAKSKNAESLIEDVKKKIEVTKQKIELLKDKIRVIDEMDND